MHDDALDLPRDEDGRVVGYQVGKAHALLEWRHRKEEREYEALFARLAAAKSARERRAADPEGARRRMNDWRDRNRVKVRAMERKRRRAKAAIRRDGACLCRNCGARFTPARNVSGTKWCSRRCRNNHHSKARSKAKNRGIRRMTIRDEVLCLLGDVPWLTARQVSRRIGAKQGSVATLLSKWAKEGELVTDGRKRKRRYAVAVVTANVREAA
jgi:hypothetical protein